MNLKLLMNRNSPIIGFLPKSDSYLSMTTLTLKLMYFSIFSGMVLMDLESNLFPNSQVVKDDENAVRNCILKVALLASDTSVFPGVVTVISDLFVPWLKAFQTYVTLSQPVKLVPLFWH